MSDDQQFLESLYSCSRPSLSHQDHLRAAWLVLTRQNLFDALGTLRRAFQSYATSKGAPHNFHETITCAFVLAINERMQRQRGAQIWEDFYRSHTELAAGKSFLYRWYSPKVLDSELARTNFVMPDRVLAGEPQKAVATTSPNHPP